MLYFIISCFVLYDLLSLYVLDVLYKYIVAWKSRKAKKVKWNTQVHYFLYAFIIVHHKTNIHLQPAMSETFTDPSSNTPKNTKKDTRNQWFFRWSMRFISVEVSDPHSHESNIHETTWLMLAINGSVCLAMYAMWLSQAVFLVKGIQKSRKRSKSKKVSVAQD